MIIQELHKIQHHHGYLPAQAMHELARRLSVPKYRIHEVASFFPHFRLEPGPKVEVLVCHDMACHLRGAAELKERLARQFAGSPDVGVRFVSCLGRCDRPVAACINEKIYAERSFEDLVRIAGEHGAGRLRSGDLDVRHNPQIATDWKIDVYRGEPKYLGVKKFLELDEGDKLLAELKDADLRGMGGAGVPAVQKWTDVRRAKGTEKYIVCNADESEPTTFKDRELLLRTAHLVLEGVILAGLLTEATRGYIYIRHEYHEQIEAMRAAIRRAEDLGACGRRIFGTERSFPVEVFVSPGGYICGEQSALIEAMEDRRAQPRNKPPTLETNGLYDKPTLVSNVETFAWVPSIWLNGGAWYRELGRPGCKGARFFSLCGDVAKPGVFEVPCGITLGELVNDCAGGMRDGLPLKAWAPSGPSGGFLPARIPLKDLPRGWDTKLPASFVEKAKAAGGETFDLLDVPLDLQCSRDLGLALGAGMMIYAEGTNMLSHALNCSEFFRNESCGKCVPCRLGSQKVVQIADSFQRREATQSQQAAWRPTIDELAKTMELTSICGLGVVAPKPLSSVMKYFPSDVAAYAAS
jgi:NADH:ubiquinone oxidoreductase subunit F (NADH-binding)/NADH:ubiquinone oxidoreductase subunit E